MGRVSLWPGPLAILNSAEPALQTPAQIFGSSLLQLVKADSSADFSLTGSLVDTWKDTVASPHDYTAAGTARPTWNSSGGPGTGLGYVSFDGSTDVMTSTLNLAVPGTTPTLGWGVIRFNRWRDLDRFVASNVSNGVQIVYQHPLTPSSIAMFNGGSFESNTIFGVATTGVWVFLAWNVTNSNSDWLLCANSMAQGEKSGNSSNNGRRIGSDVTSSRFAQVDVYTVGYASGQYDSGSWVFQKLIRYYRSILTAGIAPSSNTPHGRIIFLGDSLSNPINLHGLPASVQFQTGSNFWLRDFEQALSGQTAATIYSNITTATGKYRAAQRCIFWVWAGANDLVAGTAGTAIATTLFNICDACRATGPNAKVVLSYIMNGGTFDGVSGYTAAQETERLAANSSIASNGASHADYLSDPRNVIPNAYNPPEWSDKIHGTAVGNAYLVSPCYDTPFAAVAA